MEPTIKVGILETNKAIVNLNTHYTLNGKKLEGEFSLECKEDKIYLNGEFVQSFYVKGEDSATANFTIKDVVIGVNFHWERKEDQTFKGDLQVVVKDGQLQLINIVGVEEYLYSVISSEMSASASLDLLKAHAIISRSWLIAQLEKQQSISDKNTKSASEYISTDEIIRWYDREDHDLFDVCADDHCQRYQGITRTFSHADKVAQAIQETRGEVLMSENSICDARFSKCCGGVFEEFQNCWENIEYPYLKARRDSDKPNKYPDLSIEENAEKWILEKPEAYCNTTDKNVLSQILNDYDQETTDFFRWEIKYTNEEISNMLKEKIGIDFGEIKELKSLQRGTSARIIRLQIVGSKDKRIIGKELEIRKALSKSHLYSSAFVAKKTPEGFTLHGAGWGHGVGLCQIGAAMMADKKIGYKDILSHYFPTSELKKKY